MRSLLVSNKLRERKESLFLSLALSHRVFAFFRLSLVVFFPRSSHSRKLAFLRIPIANHSLFFMHISKIKHEKRRGIPAESRVPRVSNVLQRHRDWNEHVHDLFLLERLSRNSSHPVQRRRELLHVHRSGKKYIRRNTKREFVSLSFFLTLHSRSFDVLSLYFFLVRRARELAFYAYSSCSLVILLLLHTHFQTKTKQKNYHHTPGRKASELPKVQLPVPAAAAFAAAESAAFTAAGGVAIWILKEKRREEKRRQDKTREEKRREEKESRRREQQKRERGARTTHTKKERLFDDGRSRRLF
jgi:hypothetical protein